MLSAETFFCQRGKESALKQQTFRRIGIRHSEYGICLFGSNIGCAAGSLVDGWL